jgi:hypothetical protein
MRLTPPTNATFFVSLLILFVAILAHFVPQVAANIPFSGSFWTPVLAYVILMLGNTVKGF